eukprot:14152459-Alexandrium_andersonii.AAC.1
MCIRDSVCAARAHAACLRARVLASTAKSRDKRAPLQGPGTSVGTSAAYPAELAPSVALTRPGQRDALSWIA